MSPERTTVVRRFALILLPQFVLTLVLIVYLIGSAFIFRWLDPDLATENFFNIIFFEFGTLTTIGYGNISPSSDSARLFCIIFSIFGIPITLLTLANLGKFITKGFCYVMLVFNVSVARWKLSRDANMPLPIILCLYMITFLIGSVVISHTGQKYSVDDVYFSFISFTSVGFGDILPLTDDLRNLSFTLLYLTWGIMLTTALFRVLDEYLKKVHYLGRRFTGARDVPVWIGGHCITVSHLLMIVANEFDASPREIRDMLRDLDDLISLASQEKNEQLVPLAKDIEDFDMYD